MIRIGTVVSVSDPSQVGEARRVSAQCATAAGLSETTVARISLVATELATNLIKHAGSGTLLIGSDDDGRICLVALDKGGGIANLAAAMSDGFSTAGSSGIGLGAIDRSSASVDIYSMPDRGTALLCTVESERSPSSSSKGTSSLAAGGVCVSKKGERQPGDAWAILQRGEGMRVMVADGLGHGDSAAVAALAAVRVFNDFPDSPIEEVLARAHEVLRPTRGAAMAIAEIQPSRGSVEFAGIGNIAGTICGDQSVRKTVSHNGIVGHQMGNVQSFPYAWTDTSVLVMQSDGVGTSWDLSRYPGVTNHDPALIASVIYRDHCRGTDDATVVVAKAV